MTSGVTAANSAACLRISAALAVAPADIDPDIAADRPTRQSQSLLECPDTDLKFRIVRGCGQEHADAAHPLALLRPRHERPRRRAAERG